MTIFAVEGNLHGRRVSFVFGEPEYSDASLLHLMYQQKGKRLSVDPLYFTESSDLQDPWSAYVTALSVMDPGKTLASGDVPDPPDHDPSDGTVV